MRAFRSPSCLGRESLPSKQNLLQNQHKYITMTPSFTALPTIDLTPLSSPCPSSGELTQLSQQLDHVFATTGFAYLINPPLSLSHEAVFGLAKDFFSLPPAEKMRLAKKTFVKENSNTYRG